MHKITELSVTKRALLAKFLDGSLPQTPAALETIPRRSTAEPAPLSFGQEQLWFFAQLTPAAPVYNEGLTIDMSGPLNIAALEQSLNAFIARHEIWRTSFPTQEGQPVQMVHPAASIRLDVVDLRGLPAAERAAQALRLSAEDVLLPFDLAHGPLLRAMLVRLDDEAQRLCMTLHHIIFDAVSISHIFLPELRTLYESCASGKAASLTPLPLQYADFAAWERSSLEKAAFAQQLDFWKRELAGAPQYLDLPADRPRPAAQSYRGSTSTFALPGWLSDELKALSRRAGVTLYMTLTAAFQTLLYRYTGQEDLLLGTISSSRKRPEVQRLAGYFLNTTVLRTDMSGNPTFLELLQRVRRVLVAARQHEDVPFEYIVRELQPERHLSYHPLVQVLLSYQPHLPALPHGWSISPTEAKTSKFDLCLELDERPEGISGRLIYNTDLFDDSTIRRMCEHWQTLLAGIAADPAQRLAELPLLSARELHMQLAEWNDTTGSGPAERLFQQLFEEQVERRPAATAIVAADKVMTYQELNSMSNQLARHLLHLGVGPETLVGICMERSSQMIVAILAILKAGGAYVPLDPGYPRERLSFMLEDARVPVLITSQKLQRQLPQHAARIVALDGDWANIARYPQTNVGNELQLDNLAYVIYTSGSTGRPKGTLLTHRGLANLVQAQVEAFGITSTSRILQFASLNFDASISEIGMALASGATLYVTARDTFGQELLDYLRGQEITAATLPPSVLAALPAAELPALQTLIVAGEACPPELVARWAEGRRLFNAYGPTENTVCATIAACRSDGRRPAIGRPIANVQVYILDAHLRPLPPGAPGELYIGGEGLARGYLHRPELTAARFIPHPFSAQPGARLYKSGDLVRYRADGNIEFLGRLDDQVKVRGFRIELGEIQALLSHHPAVREAVVVTREDEPGDIRVVAYTVPYAEQAATAAELQRYLLEHMPPYMVPAAFIFLAALPLTPNGKIDRRALPAPEVNKRPQETFVAPRLLIHHQLAQIWEELLPVHPIGIHDNFFYLGGHSLLAAHLVNRIKEVFGKRLPLSTLFSGPTIAQLAGALQQEEAVQERAPLQTVQAGGSKRPFFFLHGDWTGGAFYCFALARALGPEQPFFVLEPYKFTGLSALPSLEAIAAAHIESLRALQPQGPYLLGGNCNGGLLAYEMARQLEAAGDRVDLLSLINPSEPDQLKVIRTTSKLLQRLPRLDASKLASLFLRARHALRHLYRLLRPSDWRVQDFEQLLAIDPGLKAMFPPIAALYNDYIGVFALLAAGYAPGPYAGKITFYWAGEEPAIEKSWRPVTRGRDKKQHVVPGTHTSCLSEHIEDLAECLSADVRLAQASARQSDELHCDEY